MKLTFRSASRKPVRVVVAEFAAALKDGVLCDVEEVAKETKLHPPSIRSAKRDLVAGGWMASGGYHDTLWVGNRKTIAAYKRQLLEDAKHENYAADNKVRRSPG